MVELRHLRYFVALAEELNFTRAAERLHMAQPPLSVAIRRLERELGTELLVRSTREVKLTDAGRALLDGAHRTLSELDRTITSTRRAAAGELGSLKLAFSWSARFDTLPAIGQAFRDRHPDVELLTEEMWNARMAHALHSGAIDIALSLCPEIANDISHEPIRHESIVALVAASHPLASEQAISLAELATDAFLLFPRELAPRLHDILISVCRRAGFEPTIHNGSFHTGWDLRTLAQAPTAVLTPESITRELPDGIVALPLNETSERLETSLLWRTDDLPPAATAFRDVARLFNHPSQPPLTAPQPGRDQRPSARQPAR
jgi:LysR family transcriptional regulator, benzoate and cis,cis-muconate-responsive activator of ben and cat genes